MPAQKTTPSFGAMPRLALGDAISAKAGTGILAVCAKGIVLQFPFAPDGSVAELRGKHKRAAYLKKSRQPDRI
ncbi:MAG: hypothetical protein JKY31_07275 [Rhodobacteraceae bacterium]|nr:hypothetical protein [Paracoccaceae bacterium]